MKNIIHYTTAQCDLGFVLVAESDRGLCAIAFGDNTVQLIEELHKNFPNENIQLASSDLDSHMAEVLAFIEAPQTSLKLPLDIHGTTFQKKVWQAIAEIPPGSTSTYSEIATRINSPKAVRAVASACAANRLAIAIPCHRVIQKDGSLAGYRWGVERKWALLAREATISLAQKPL